jgi:hypothetical protein
MDSAIGRFAPELVFTSVVVVIAANRPLSQYHEVDKLNDN